MTRPILARLHPFLSLPLQRLVLDFLDGFLHHPPHILEISVSINISIGISDCIYIFICILMGRCAGITLIPRLGRKPGWEAAAWPPVSASS